VKLALQNAKAAFAQEKRSSRAKRKMLLDLQEQLKLNRYPKRNRMFDTFHISGTDLVSLPCGFY